MMKTIGIAFFVLVTSFFTPVQDEIKTTTATYIEYADGEYFFKADGEDISFQGIEESARGIYNLTDNKYVGKTFDITYKVRTVKEEGEDPFYLFIIKKIEKK